VSEAHLEGAVNAPSKGSRTPNDVTGADIARLTESLRSQSRPDGNIDAFLANLTTLAAQHVPGTRCAGIVIIGRDKQI
jgi:hypothetical protein